MALKLFKFFSGEEMGREETSQFGEAMELYLEGLKSRRPIVPASAYGFATAEWHYDSSDRRSIRYSRLLKLDLVETPINDEKRKLEIALFLAGYSGGDRICLRYHDVRAYDLSSENETPVARRTGRTSHGQLLVDELEVTEVGLVVHHILWNNQAHWQIVCTDVAVSYQEP